jgi:AraC-like DNA-binding protein
MQVLKKESQLRGGYIAASRKRFEGTAAPHIHEFFEIEYIEGGQGRCIVDGRAYEMEAGTLFLLTPANTHAVKESAADIVNVMFRCDYADPAFSAPLLCPPSPLFLIPTQDRPLVQALLGELVKIHKTDTDFARALLGCLLRKLSSYSTVRAEDNLPYINRSLLYITENFRKGVTLDSVAAHLALCPTYLSELFTKTLGISFKAYLDRIRFSCAQNLLAFTDLPVCEIPTMVGFGDYANFSRRFKQIFGMTPGDYRKRENGMGKQ